MLKQLGSNINWDIIIIGGGATGLGTALDAASRGLKTILVEQHDFAKATSGRSTKLVHGGVRYLAKGNIKLVAEALLERGRLLKNAPHITNSIAFILPVYSNWKKWFYGLGLKFYDILSGRLSLGKTSILTADETLRMLPSLAPDHLKGGIRYFDGQFNDTRLALDLAESAVYYGATVINYVKLTGFIKEKNKITQAIVYDTVSNQEFILNGKAFVNATGVFSETVAGMDDPQEKLALIPSRGIHIVIDQAFFEGTQALIIPETNDGRVLFAVPWENKVVVGTTDTKVDQVLLEPVATDEEIEFLLNHFNKYCKRKLMRSDIKSVFAGLRPLVKSESFQKTSMISREHAIIVSKAGLISVIGGKWTTYRKMAQDVVNNAIFVSKLPKTECLTQNLPIGNWGWPIGRNNPLHVYGSNKTRINKLLKENPAWSDKIHPSFPHIKAEIIWFIRNEMALTVEDILARRTRILFLDANAAIQAAQSVADVMCVELHKDEAWKESQINSFCTLAQEYLVK